MSSRLGESSSDPFSQNNAKALSQIVRDLASVLPKDEPLTVRQGLRLIGVHGFVFLLLVLALLNLAIFMLPGLSLFFGAAMATLAVQMALGLPEPVMPAFLSEFKIEGLLLQKGLAKAEHFLTLVEKAICPRFLFLTDGPLAVRIHAMAALFLGLLVAIPVPFLNVPPTLGMACLALGLLQRDGIFVIGGYGFALWSLWLYASLQHAAFNLF